MGSPNKEDDGAETNPKISISSDQSPFSEGEKVLAYHGPRIYEAKVQKVEFRKEWRFFVHYLGWNKNWDEWVGADRLLKYTEESVKRQQSLAKNQSSDKNAKSGRSAQNKPKSSNDTKADKEDLRNFGGRGKKRKSDSGIEEKDTGSTVKLVAIQFPSTLKKQLVDDWEFVTQLGKLVKLPRTPNVDDILKKYLDYRSKKDGTIAESVGEILSGLRGYFDKALPAMLLYKRERQQYHETITDNISPSTIYGAEHLLRLFVKLPELLAYVNMEEEALKKLQQKLLDFLKYLQKNQSAFFLSTYDGSKGFDEPNEEKDTGSTVKLVAIQFPSTLKKQLVDDWEFVTQLGKLVKLPRTPNVDDILKKYLDYRSKKDGTIAESVGEILSGLRGYFDKALPAMLLYKRERQQYHETITDNISPSTIYGAEHLLRLFVKLPELLAYVNMEEEALKKLQQKLLDFLKYLQKNQSAFFLSTYDGSKGFEEPNEEYTN